MRDANEHPFTRYRKAHGLSIADFAELVGVDRTAISKCEHRFRDGLGRLANIEIEKKTKGALTVDELARFVWSRKRRVRTGARKAASS